MVSHGECACSLAAWAERHGAGYDEAGAGEEGGNLKGQEGVRLFNLKGRGGARLFATGRLLAQLERQLRLMWERAATWSDASSQRAHVTSDLDFSFNSQQQQHAAQPHAAHGADVSASASDHQGWRRERYFHLILAETTT